MTDDQINIAIAEACGWKEDRSSYHPNKRWISPKGNICIWCPDYCHDLNAMHEAEKQLHDRVGLTCDMQCQRYEETLREVLRRDKGLSPSPFGMVIATARQRAEAFLRTIGKWEGGER